MSQGRERIKLGHATGETKLKALSIGLPQLPPMSHALLKRLRFLNGGVLTSGAAQFFNLDEYGIA